MASLLLGKVFPSLHFGISSNFLEYRFSEKMHDLFVTDVPFVLKAQLHCCLHDMLLFIRFDVGIILGFWWLFDLELSFLGWFGHYKLIMFFHIEIRDYIR